MYQSLLIDAPYQPHSQTSREAAQKITLVAPTCSQRVLAYLKRCSGFGATDSQIQSALNMNPSTQRPRRIELVKKGLVKDSGRKRKTKRGWNAVVWIAK